MNFPVVRYSQTLLSFCILSSVLLITGCANQGAKDSYDPMGKLTQTLAEYQVTEGELNCHTAQQARVDCEGLASALAALNLQYPNNQRIALNGAMVYFELGRYNDSQLLLDQLLAQPYANAEAAVLRSQLALMEGNFTLARSVIQRQLEWVPDHPELYAAQAASYYLEGRYEKARGALRAADRLGLASWRTSYHLGLIYEAQQQWPMACSHYTRVLQLQPNHRAAVGRLLFLSEHSECRVPPAARRLG